MSMFDYFSTLCIKRFKNQKKGLLVKLSGAGLDMAKNKGIK